MEILLRQQDTFRIQTNQNRNFIDVSGMDHEQGIKVTAFPYFHYIEVREKNGELATFYFQNKGAKKHINLGYWQDAEVVFARNNVGK